MDELTDERLAENAARRLAEVEGELRRLSEARATQALAATREELDAFQGQLERWRDTLHGTLRDLAGKGTPVPAMPAGPVPAFATVPPPRVPGEVNPALGGRAAPDADLARRNEDAFNRTEGGRQAKGDQKFAEAMEKANLKAALESNRLQESLARQRAAGEESRERPIAAAQQRAAGAGMESARALGDAGRIMFATFRGAGAAGPAGMIISAALGAMRTGMQYAGQYADPFRTGPTTAASTAGLKGAIGEFFVEDQRNVNKAKQRAEHEVRNFGTTSQALGTFFNDLMRGRPWSEGLEQLAKNGARKPFGGFKEDVNLPAAHVGDPMQFYERLQSAATTMSGREKSTENLMNQLNVAFKDQQGLLTDLKTIMTNIDAKTGPAARY